MGRTLTEKILNQNLIKGVLLPGEEITVKVNQTLTQDSTGTMVYLQLEAMNIKEIKTDLSVAYIDHNTLQFGFENADDHDFLQSAAKKYGLTFSKAGGGICHQLHLERFGIPGGILLGSDSHTPTGGGLGMLAIGAGGLDVAAAMATGEYKLKVPTVFGIQLLGKLPPWSSAKDVILKILQTLTVKGGVGRVLEYFGPGVSSLSVTDRATIANMGAELGATSSIFPCDEITADFLRRQGREACFSPISADSDAKYEQILTLDLQEIFPMVAMPHSPDSVTELSAFLEKRSLKVDQIAIGSCTNSSYTDLMKVASILDGRSVAPHVSLVIAPGSSGILELMAKNGGLASLLNAGARILEAACGPCIGMGQAPKTKAVSLRTFNRNFKGRCGTKDAEVYLVSPEVAAASAITGYLTEPSDLGLEVPTIPLPEKFPVCESYFIRPLPLEERKTVSLEMGPNIKPFPLNKPMKDHLQGALLLKVGDHVTTDDIMPSDASLLPFRSNIPELSKHCFGTLVSDFSQRAKEHHGGFVIGGDNYGQGSSREHAALVPLYLGIRCVIAKSFARIHKANLINSGILPLTFSEKEDYSNLCEFDELFIPNIREALINRLKENQDSNITHSVTKLLVQNKTQSTSFNAFFDGTSYDLELLLSGGYLNYLKESEVL